MKKGFITTLAIVLAGSGAAVAQAPASLGRPVPASLGRPVPVTQVSYVQASGGAQPAPVAQAGPPSPTLTEPIFRGQDPIDPCAPGCGVPEAGGGGGGCCSCGTRWYGSSEYLMWWIKNSPVGPSSIDNEMRNGGRFTVGYWFDPNQTFGMEGNYLFLAPRSVTEQLGGNVLDIRSSLQGAEANGIWNFYNCNCWRLGLIGGFRFLELDEKLTLTTLTPSIDHFDMHNRFYGGQVGLRGEYKCCGWFINGTGKIALGGVHETQDIAGQNGLLTGPTNIGHHSSSQFAVVPEVNVNVGYDFNQWVRVFVGYDFLYINHVLRPGNQIDFSGADAVLNNPSSFWAQGVNFGVELRF